MNGPPFKSGSESTPIIDIPWAVSHVIKCFDVEEEAYASIEKFGYERLLDYLQRAGAEPGSVCESQLTGYWSRAAVLNGQLRSVGESTLAARQQFAKHANAASAILSTIVGRLYNDYLTGRSIVRTTLGLEAEKLGSEGLLFTAGADFDPDKYQHEILAPIFTQIKASLRGNLPDSTSWPDACSEVPEPQRFRNATKPVTAYLLTSFDVVVSYVISDGSLPQPGVPSGELLPWIAEC